MLTSLRPEPRGAHWTVLALAAIIAACSSAPSPDDASPAENVAHIRQAMCNWDGNCEPELGENFDDCPTDCYGCGDGVCDSAITIPETCSSCAADCGECIPADPCDYDVICEPAQGEHYDNCVTDCWGCGDGVCDTAASDPETCASCSTDCGSCGGGGPCDHDGVCEAARGENGTNCSGDCWGCGDGLCDGSTSTPESCSSCAADCGGCGGTTCCGDPTDPCGWNGNGTCDTGCAWGQDVDCTGGAQCCSDAGDPCGWRGDGTCHTGCAWGGDPDCAPSGCTDCACTTAPDPDRLAMEQRWQVAAACPVIGGQANVNVALTIEDEIAVGSCPMYDAFANGTGQLAVHGTVCGLDRFHHLAPSSYDAQRTYCRTCDTATCEWDRADTYCGYASASGDTTLGTSTLQTFQMSWNRGADGDLPALELEMSCGISVNGTLAGSADATVTENRGCGTCQDGVEGSAHFEANAAGRGGCEIVGRTGDQTFSLGCPDCAEMNVGVSSQPSADPRCLGIDVESSVRIEVPCFDAAIAGWFGNSVSCTAEASGRAHGDGCAGPGKPVEERKLVCRVNAADGTSGSEPTRSGASYRNAGGGAQCAATSEDTDPALREDEAIPNEVLNELPDWVAERPSDLEYTLTGVKCALEVLTAGGANTDSIDTLKTLWDQYDTLSDCNGTLDGAIAAYQSGTLSEVQASRLYSCIMGAIKHTEGLHQVAVPNVPILSLVVDLGKTCAWFGAQTLARVTQMLEESVWGELPEDGPSLAPDLEMWVFYPQCKGFDPDQHLRMKAEVILEQPYNDADPPYWKINLFYRKQSDQTWHRVTNSNTRRFDYVGDEDLGGVAFEHYHYYFDYSGWSSWNDVAVDFWKPRYDAVPAKLKLVWGGSTIFDTYFLGGASACTYTGEGTPQEPTN